MQKRYELVCEDSLCPKKLLDVSRSGLEEAGRYNDTECKEITCSACRICFADTMIKIDDS